eukprot:PITA_25065
MFKDCITAVRSCHACPIFDSKTKRPPAPLQPVVAVGPFAKWGIDFMTCNPTSAGGNGYIIVAAIVTDHGSHFRNHMMVELAAKLGLSHNSSTPYYPFTPFQLVYGLEAILPVQCEISSLKLAVDLLLGTSEEEARFLELIQLDETHRDAALANEAHKK